MQTPHLPNTERNQIEKASSGMILILLVIAVIVITLITYATPVMGTILFCAGCILMFIPTIIATFTPGNYIREKVVPVSMLVGIGLIIVGLIIRNAM